MNLSNFTILNIRLLDQDLIIAVLLEELVKKSGKKLLVIFIFKKRKSSFKESNEEIKWYAEASSFSKGSFIKEDKNFY